MKSGKSTEYIIESWEVAQLLPSPTGRWALPGLGSRSSDRCGGVVLGSGAKAKGHKNKDASGS